MWLILNIKVLRFEIPIFNIKSCNLKLNSPNLNILPELANIQLNGHRFVFLILLKLSEPNDIASLCLKKINLC